MQKRHCNRGRKLPPEPLTDDEIDAVAKAANPRYPTGARNRALVLVLAHSGLRISEALALRPKDYDAARGTLRVLRGKGGKHRVAPVSGAGAAALARWMEHRRAAGVGRGAPLLCTLDGGAMQASYCRGLLPRLARRAGIAKRVHPHGMRHSFATESVRRGVPINALSRVLGHSSSGVTARYIDHLGADGAAEAVRACWGDDS